MVGGLSTLSFELCQLQGVTGVGMIPAEGRCPDQKLPIIHTFASELSPIMAR